MMNGSDLGFNISKIRDLAWNFRNTEGFTKSEAERK
jgi:hypothetical protein